MFAKRFLLVFISFVLLMGTFGCSDYTNSPVESESQTEAPLPKEFVIASKGDKETRFTLAYNVDMPKAEKQQILRIRDALKYHYNVSIQMVDDFYEEKETNYEILIASKNRPEAKAITDTLAENEYSIQSVVNGEKSKIIIAYKGQYALIRAISRFLSEFVTTEKAAVPIDLNVKGTSREEDNMITSSIPTLRDPSILVVDGVYYAYGTGWLCYKNTSGSLSGEWESLGNVVTSPAHATANQWAPEVYAHNGAYYMFTTYFSDVTQHRGCSVLRAESPEGPFVEISNGHVSPTDWDAIDGTLYVDDDGQPWMIFVHEWTSTENGVGRMAAAKLSDDLTHFISEPIELFSASDAPWAKSVVTDGCWMYRCQTGELLMIWSSFGTDGYRVGIARSESGKIDGKWTHDKTPLYAKEFGMEHDGGHGMIFTDFDGQMYLSIHSPNTATEERASIPVFIAIREENGTLVWDAKEAK